MKKSIFIYTIILAMAVFAAACGEADTGNTTAKLDNTNSAVPPVDASPSPAPKEPVLDVPYVPTPVSVVNEMLAMAKVTGEDVLYDLGSGDGRIPITAARKFGTKGVGIDLNPVRVEEANKNAEQDKVTDKVTFKVGDIFKEDFSEATVVTLYLLPDVNMKLRPKILEMKPGTRVVSHNYDMGDWTPDETKKISVDGTDHYVYFWTVPEKKEDKK